MADQNEIGKKRVNNFTIIQRLYAWACRRLYYELAWSYDFVSWVVSAGRWDAWRGAALSYVGSGRVLELGFGTGELLMQLVHHDRTVYGIDLSPKMHQIVKRKLQRRKYAHDAPHVNLALASAESLPFPSGTVDTIVSTFPAPYILEPSTLRECARTLIPYTGKLVIVGLWVTPRTAGWLQRLPVFFGAPTAEEIQALAEPFRAAGLEPTFETFQDNWADVSIIVAKCKP